MTCMLHYLVYHFEVFEIRFCDIKVKMYCMDGVEPCEIHQLSTFLVACIKPSSYIITLCNIYIKFRRYFTIPAVIPSTFAC